MTIDAVQEICRTHRVRLHNTQGEVRMGLSDGEADYLSGVLTSGRFNVTDNRRAAKRKLLAAHPEARRAAFPTPLYVLKYPVTVELFALFCFDAGYRTQAEVNGDTTTWRTGNFDDQGHLIRERGNLPVTFVAHADTQAFCNWLETCKINSPRLLTSAEYEYAVRAGRDRDSLFPWGGEFQPGRCNDRFWGGHKGCSPVDEFADKGGSSRDGLLDLCGNVFEWLEDKTDGAFGMAAGGSHRRVALVHGHAAARARPAFATATGELGFRVVWSP